MQVNEGLPAHVIELAKQKTDLHDKTVGILGMTFKAESDDIRDSLSFKLRRLLTFESRKVLCHDPFWTGPGWSPLEDVLSQSDVIFVATPHSAYAEVVPPPGKIVIDVWNRLASPAIPDAERNDEPRNGIQAEGLTALSPGQRPG